MSVVVLGNRHAVHSTDNGETLEPMTRGKRATVIEIPDDYDLLQAFTAITHPQGVWSQHAAEGKAPAWVATDIPGLDALLAAQFKGIEVRQLEDDGTLGGAVAAAVAGTAGLVTLLSLSVLAVAGMLLKVSPFLKTNGGQDFQAAQMAGSASATAVAKFMAITANATAESASDTTLTAEIATAGGGLIRNTAVYAHTTSAASYTLTGTFTANGTDSLPVTVAKMAVFTASSAGTMVFEKLLGTTATLSASGDSLVITQTVSM